MDLLENCEICYPFTLSEFPETIVIEGNLDPAKQYYFKFTDKFQNSYVTEQLTPDADGVVTVQVIGVDPTPTTSFIEPIPSAAWFNKNAGRFYIEASETVDVWEPVEFHLGGGYGSTYTCIVVEFVNDNSEMNTIV